MSGDLIYASTDKAAIAWPQIIDCKEVLNRYGVTFKEGDYYLEVHDMPQQKTWLLHLSVIKIQFNKLLEVVLPYLIGSGVPFAVAKNSESVKHLLDGSYGYSELGKLICIYTRDAKEAVELARELIHKTAHLKGPAIPTDILLGEIVYTMYGKFDTNGNYSYTIPFSFPKGIAWPFYEIAQPGLPAPKKLLNDKYKPLHAIRLDPKGRVLKGNYFKSLFNIKLCLIKEGCQNIWSDNWGRDIVDRLKWQYELYMDLAGEVNTPPIFDFFFEQGKAYLVMEFIKGDGLEDRIATIYSGKNWQQLSLENKKDLVGYLLEIIKVVGKLHAKGYVHRDITPPNFIIDKKGKLFLIDMELAYSYKNNKPNPAFRLGTPGYASPEQLKHKTPTVKEDIYALGSLMITLFTGLSPVKFEGQPAVKRQESVLFFTGNEAIAALIRRCANESPERRPGLEEIRGVIEQFYGNLPSNNIPAFNPAIIEEENLTKLINRGLMGLLDPRVIDEHNLWRSVKTKVDEVEGYQPVKRRYYPTWHTGMAGILFLIAKAKLAGFNVEPCGKAFEDNWAYIKETVFNVGEGFSVGLFDGLAGIALMINDGMESGMLSDPSYKQYLERCFSNHSSRLDLASGIAGQGLALLHCYHKMETDFANELLGQYVNELIQQQQLDGSWNIIRVPGKKKEKIIGLAHGVAGILYFLLEYAVVFKDDNSAKAIHKGLNWFIKQMHKKRENIYWNTTTKSNNVENWGINIGIPGIVLVFIKAYTWSNDPLYKRIAEKALYSLPDRPIHTDFTQAYGLAGLGEVYLEAQKAFNNAEWQKRAAWISQIFVHTFLNTQHDNGYWSVNIYPDFEPDLMTGTSGIIYFLMRYLKNKELPYLFSI